jgi:hypothetical protein
MEPTNQGEQPQEASKLKHVIQIDEGKIPPFMRRKIAQRPGRTPSKWRRS